MTLPFAHSPPKPRRNLSAKMLLPGAAVLAVAALWLIDMRAALVGALCILLLAFARIVFDALR